MNKYILINNRHGGFGIKKELIKPKFRNLLEKELRINQEFIKTYKNKLKEIQGDHCELEIVQVDDKKFFIYEYDGYEEIFFKDDKSIWNTFNSLEKKIKKGEWKIFLK